jgi:hypothetical protein
MLLEASKLYTPLYLKFFKMNMKGPCEHALEYWMELINT